MLKAQTIWDISKDKEFEIQIPIDIKEAGKMLGAVFFQFGQTECLTVFNPKYLYFLQIVDGKVGKFSSFNISNISQIVSIIKGYLLVTTKEHKLWLLEVKKLSLPSKASQPKQQQKQQQNAQKVLTVESFLKQVAYTSYFLREVSPNMIELFITSSNDKSNKVLYIYQFTVKQKVGGMGFTLDKNLKIVTESKKQLYASKVYYDPLLTSIVKLKNFSDRTFTIKRIQEDFIYIFPIWKTQQYFCLNKSCQLFNAENSSNRKSIRDQLKQHSLQNAITHLNFILLPKKNGKLTLFQVQESLKVKELGEQSNQYKWQICFNARLVGISKDNQVIKITKQLFRRTDKPQLNQQLKFDESSDNKLAREQPTLPKVQQNNEKKDIKQNEDKSDKQEKNKKDKKQKNKKQKNSNGDGIGKQKNDQLPQQSKQKSNFKPVKILSRKDLAKDKKVQQQVVAQNSEQKQKKIQPSQKSQKVQSQQIITKNQQKPKQIQITKQKQKQAVLSNQKVQQKKQSGSVKQLQGKEVQKNGQEHQKQSPFSKKHLVKDAKVQIIIPNISLNKFMGINQNKTSPVNVRKDSSELIKPSPFRKKSQSLVIDQDKKQEKVAIKIDHQQKAQTNVKQQVKIQNNTPIHKKMELKQQQNLVQKQLKNIQKQQKKLQGPEKCERMNEKSQVKVTEQKCCNNFLQVKNSYEEFTTQIRQFQDKSTQILSSANNLATIITREVEGSINKSCNNLWENSEQKASKSITASVQGSINDYFAHKLTGKVNEYFKCVTNDTKKIYDSSLKFYTAKKKQSIISLQNHFQQQEHLVNQIRLISLDMLACVQNTVNEGEETHATMLKQWDKINSTLNAKLDANLQMIQNHGHDRSASQRRQIIDTLAQLKDSISNQQAKQQKIEQIPVKPKKKKQKQEVHTVNKNIQKHTHKQKQLRVKKKGGDTQRAHHHWIPPQYGPYSPYY